MKDEEFSTDELQAIQQRLRASLHMIKTLEQASDYILDSAVNSGYVSGWFDGASIAAEELEARGFKLAAEIVRGVAGLSGIKE